MPHHRWYIEVFAGSCVLLLNKPQSEREFANDKFTELVCFWQVVQDPVKCRILQERMLNAIDSNYLFEKFREQDPKNLDMIDRAWRFLYLTKFGFNSYHDTYHKPLSARMGKLKNFINTMINAGKRIIEYHNRIQQVKFSDWDFRKVLETVHPNSDKFFFLDPPYMDTHSYDDGYYEEAEKGDNIYIDMRKQLAKHTKGGSKWMITCNNKNKFFDDMKNVRLRYISRRACINKNEERKDVRTKVVMNYPKECEGTVFELLYDDEKKSQGDFGQV